jgi:hypothetical protein
MSRIDLGLARTGSGFLRLAWLAGKVEIGHSRWHEQAEMAAKEQIILVEE